MAPENLVILTRAVGMILAMTGGICIARYGFIIAYRKREAAKTDRIVFEVRSFKLKAHSIGPVMICTAFLWAWAGVSLCPNFEKDKDKVRVYSFHTANYKIEAEPIITPTQIQSQIRQEKPETLIGSFRSAITDKPSGEKYRLWINGEPAVYDFNSINIENMNSGKNMLTATASSGASRVDLTFEPLEVDKKLRFVPRAAKDALPLKLK